MGRVRSYNGGPGTINEGVVGMGLFSSLQKGLLAGQLFGSFPRAVECFGTMFEVDMGVNLFECFICWLARFVVVPSWGISFLVF